jgi:hypothetical protein
MYVDLHNMQVNIHISNSYFVGRSAADGGLEAKKLSVAGAVLSPRQGRDLARLSGAGTALHRCLDCRDLFLGH